MPIPWIFRTTKVAYYVNDTLVDEIEFFPCLSGDNSTTSNSQTILSSILNRHSYSQDLRALDLTLCSSPLSVTGLPNNRTFLLASARSDRTGDSLEKLKRSLLAITNVIWTINSQHVNNACLSSKLYSATKQNVEAELKIG
jgi:hypothetical protein